MEISGLSYRWPTSDREQSAHFQIQIENFALQQSETVFLHGLSGSGKSTLLALLCGTVGPDKGEIHFEGNRIDTLSSAGRDKHRANHVGMIFQSFNLLPYLSAIDNVLLPLGFSKSRADKAGETLEQRRDVAVRLLEALGLDISQISNAKPGNLSVGQQQRVAAARALIGQPKLIIADEPTSALDDNNQQAFIALLFSELKTSGASLLMVSHNRNLESEFDRTCQIIDGKLQEGATV